jgi:serine/threonine-protein kinase
LIVSQPDGSRSEIVLSDKPVNLGNAADNDVVIEDIAISRHHARLEKRSEAYFISDLKSLNGTLVNGQNIGQREVALNEGDQIALGRTKIVFRLEPAKQQQSKKIEAEEVPRMTAIISPTAPPPPPPPAPKLIDPTKAPLPTQQAKPDSAPFRVARTGELIMPEAESKEQVKETPRMVLDRRYELIGKLSQDETGTRYRARRLMLGDEVTVRVLRPELVKDEVAVERFRRQAQIAARIKHPNSVQVFDFGYSAEGAAYLVEELLTGRTLRDLINEERGLSLTHVVSLMNQICGAVHAAHLNGIVLRGLNPETIFIEQAKDGSDLVKVGGYGLAKLSEGLQTGGAALTGPLGVFGAPEYTSPEQWMNRQLDARSDVYALGAILFELLTGAPPFTAEIPSEFAGQHINSPVPDLMDFVRGDLNEGVAAVVNRALAKEPEQRQASALQLATELQSVSGVSNLFFKATGLLPVLPIVVAPPAPTAAGEAVSPSVLPREKVLGHGAFNPVVMALMAEAFLSRLSSGMIKTAVPLYALLVFGMKITSVMGLVLVQNVVPLLLRPVFGTLADKYGKKKIFLISLTIRTVVSVLYAVATLPLLFIISAIRGIADSAKGPSASAMIADHTDEKNIAQAYSWYTTTKSTSGGIGEALAAFTLVILLTIFAGFSTVNVNVAVLDKVSSSGANAEEIIKDISQIQIGAVLPGNEADPKAHKVLRVEQRQMKLSSVAIDDLPKVVDPAPLRKALVTIFIVSTILSLASLLLVAIFIKEKKKEKKDKKDKKDKPAKTGQLDAPEEQPSVWAFALLGTALTAPAYMVTGEFFTILAVKLDVTPGALGWIKIFSETLVPLLFGPFFGWLADRIGAGKVIALRSVANLLTSALFWIVPWFAGTALLGLVMGIARAVDEIGKAAFKPTWGAIAAKVSSYNLDSRSKTMGILEGGVDASDLAFPVIAGIMLQYLSLGPLMLVRGLLAIVAEIYGFFLMRKYKI